VDDLFPQTDLNISDLLSFSLVLSLSLFLFLSHLRFTIFSPQRASSYPATFIFQTPGRGVCDASLLILLILG
jgi:hypothetical protein